MRQLCIVVLSVDQLLTQFLSNRSQYVMVDGCQSIVVNVVSGVLQVGVLGPLLLLLYTSEHFSILENKLIGYAMAPLCYLLCHLQALELQ